jgi:hypothetical protein
MILFAISILPVRPSRFIVPVRVFGDGAAVVAVVLPEVGKINGEWRMKNGELF